MAHFIWLVGKSTRYQDNVVDVVVGIPVTRYRDAGKNGSTYWDNQYSFMIIMKLYVIIFNWCLSCCSLYLLNHTWIHSFKNIECSNPLKCPTLQKYYNAFHFVSFILLSYSHSTFTLSITSTHTHTSGTCVQSNHGDQQEVYGVTPQLTTSLPLIISLCLTWAKLSWKNPSILWCEQKLHTSSSDSTQSPVLLLKSFLSWTIPYQDTVWTRQFWCHQERAIYTTSSSLWALWGGQRDWHASTLVSLCS